MRKISAIILTAIILISSAAPLPQPHPLRKRWYMTAEP